MLLSRYSLFLWNWFCFSIMLKYILKVNLHFLLICQM